MEMEINNMMDVIDSRDTIERIEELEKRLKIDYNAVRTAATFEEWIEDTNSQPVIEYCILKEKLGETKCTTITLI